MKITSSSGESLEFINNSNKTSPFSTQLVIKKEGQATTCIIQDRVDRENICMDSSYMLEFLVKNIDEKQREIIAKSYIADNPEVIGEVVRSWAYNQTEKDREYRDKAAKDECTIHMLAIDLNKDQKDKHMNRLVNSAERFKFCPKDTIIDMYKER